MKTYLTLIALVGFISISLFGLLTINHDSGHNIECLAMQLNGSDAPCPKADPLGFASFHNNAFKKISNLILVDTASIVYLIAMIILIFLSFFIFQSFESNFIINQISPFFRLKTRNYKLTARQLFWFSLHEKRDPAFIL